MNGIRQLYTIALLLFCIPVFYNPVLAAEVQSQVLVQPGRGEMPLSHYLDYYIDETLSMDIEDIADPLLAPAFAPFSLENLPREEGITWLRFTISPLPPETKPATFLLDMGQSIPGTPVLYDPERNELSGALEWHENLPAHRNILLLPEEGRQPVTCYIKLEGLPGPWFYPMIRTPQNAASNLLGLSRTGAILALAVVMLLCLLRGASEKGQWRIWTALFVAVALAQALLGMPVTSLKFSVSALAATLLPGIALMLLPHVGRHLLNTPKLSRNLDLQLFLLSLPGAAIALLPLVPTWHWLDRWVDFWPAVTVIFIPTALGAWISGLRGAKRFLLACVIPPLFVGFAWAGIDFGFPANFLASLPLWGVALSALILVTSGSPQPSEPEDPNKKKKSATDSRSSKNEQPVINLENPLGDPHLRLVEPVEPNGSEAHDDSQREQLAPVKEEEINWLQTRENALREPLDDILRQGAALGDCSLPPAVRQYAEQIITQAGNMADIMSGAIPQELMDRRNQFEETEKVFNLQQLLRDVHNSIAPGAEAAGTALSWYMPPHLSRMFKGQPEKLKNTLAMMLESAVRASRNGTVHLTARRVPESAEEGHILFSITDNGSGVPPRDRSTLAIARAWELIGRNGGYLAMEASPNGVSVALSMHFEPVEETDENESPAKPGLMILGDDDEERRALHKILADLPCRIVEAANTEEVLEQQNRSPVPLLVVTGKMARPASADITKKFTELAHKAGYAHCNILAVTEDDSQWELLKPSGFTHAMIRETDSESIRKTVSDLLDALSAQNVQLTETVITDTDSDSLNPGEIGSADGQAEKPHAEIPPDSQTKPEAETFTNREEPVQTQMEQPEVKADKNPSFQTFEGPYWLTGLSAREDAELEENRKDENELQENNHQAAEDNSETFTEWVGEPVPVSTARQNQHIEPVENESANQLQQSPDGENPERKDAQGGSFLNFIVEVKRKLSGTNETPSNEGKKVADIKQDHPLPEHAPENAPNPDTAGNSKTKNSEDFILQNTESASVDKKQQTSNLDPVLAALVEKLDKAMKITREAYERGDAETVVSATSEMAATSEKVGLRILARMAGCVERAGRQKDLQAISDLLPDLETAVERNRIALTQTPVGRKNQL